MHLLPLHQMSIVLWGVRPLINNAVRTQIQWEAHQLSHLHHIKEQLNRLVPFWSFDNDQYYKYWVTISIQNLNLFYYNLPHNKSFPFHFTVIAETLYGSFIKFCCNFSEVVGFFILSCFIVINLLGSFWVMLHVFKWWLDSSIGINIGIIR